MSFGDTADGAGVAGPVPPAHLRVLEPAQAPDGSALTRCISVGQAEFAEHYWGQRPLLSPSSSTGADFSDLLSIGAVDELISRRGLRTPFVRMAKAGSVLASSDFTRSGGVGAAVGDQVADDKVLGEFAAGATLVLQALHRNWPPLMQFGTTLSSELGHPVQINAYVTPPQNQGFAAHYDTHDVFVLQVTGTKQWVIHEPVVRAPLPDQQWEKHRGAVAARVNEKPTMTVSLQPGDALYLPRGYLHSATALGELSIHLTVGVHPVTKHALVRELVAATTDNPELRGALPMGVDLSDPSVLAPYLAEVAEQLANAVRNPDHLQLSRIADRVGAELLRNTRPAPVAPLAQLAALGGPIESTRFRVRPGLRTVVHSAADCIRISFLDKEIRFPPAQESALKLALSGATFGARELTGLSADDQEQLVRRLLGEALVVPEPDV